MEADKEKIQQLEDQLANHKEDLFLAKIDLEKCRTENIALRGFIQNVYESCEGLEGAELTLEEVLHNLRKNIRIFSRDHQIRL
ncbi:MAG: hypothetical protein RIF33_12580 [Cyclobacteriaceae bacterium]